MLEVIEKAERTALTEPFAVLAEVGRDADDVLVQRMIDRASATIESVCGRRFAMERVRQTFTGTTGPILTRWPVRELHSVSVDGEALEVVAFGADAGILIHRDGRPWRPSRAVVVEYTAGYRLPGDPERDLPHDIERVAIELVKFDWYSATRDPSIRSESVDGVSNIQFFGSGSSINAIVSALEAYRQPVAL